METRVELWERLRRTRDWAVSIDDLEREVEELPASQQSIRLFQLGLVSEEVIPERDRALGIYQRAWKVDRENLRALAQARKLYHELGRLEMVAKLGAIELRTHSEEAGSELAGLVGEALLDCRERDRALPLLEQALENDPDSYRLKDAIAAAGYDQEFWQDTVDRLCHDADNVDSVTASRMLLRAARILHLEAPDDERYEGLLKRALENDAQNENGNFLYEQLLGATERWEELDSHHERRGTQAADDNERSQLYRKFALEWIQRFKDRDRAAKYFVKAIESSAQNGAINLRSLVAAFALIRESCAAKADWQSFLKLADACLDKLEGEQKLYVALQAGLVAWREIGDRNSASPYFELVRGIEPEAPDLLDYDASGSNDDNEVASQSEEVAEAAAEAKPKKKKKKKKKKSKKTEAQPASAEQPAESDASAAEEPAVSTEPAPTGDGEVAAEPAPTDDKDAADAAPADAPAEDAADAPAEDAADASAEDAADAAPADVAPAEDAAADEPEELTEDTLAAMDAARQTESAGPDKAIDAWRKVVAGAPSVRGPRRELARVLREAKRWNALVEALKDESQKIESERHRVAVLKELAAVYREHLRNDVQSLNTLQQIAKLQPSNIEIYDELASQYEAKKRWPDLVKTLNAKAEHLQSEEERVALYLRIARLYIERFSNQAEAIRAFERVLAIDTENREAIEHLMAVYEKRRDWEKLLRLKETELERIEDEVERSEQIYAVAKLAATKVKKPDVCIVWWEKVLKHDPAHEEAISELYRLYERAKNWERLAEVCAKQANIASESGKRVEALQKLGLLYTDKLSDTQKAIDAWNQLLQIDPDHRRAQDALKKLYIAAKDWQALEDFYRARDKIDEFVRVLERQVDGDSDSENLALAMKIAVMYRDEVKKADRAMRAFEKVLTLDESNLEAAEALIPLYETGRDPRKLVRALTIQLEQTDDSELRRERMQRLAEYSEEKLRDKGAAFGWWLKAHAENYEAADIREQLERLAAESASWTELVDAYRASYDKFSDPKDALPLMEVVARVQEQELGEVDDALETNRAIIELDDTNEVSLAALERLYLGKQQYEDLLAIYTRKLDLVGDPDQQTEIQFKIGQLYEEEVEDDEKAIDAYRAIVDATGENVRALRALDRLYTRNTRWQDLADALERQLLIVDPVDEQDEYVGLKYRMGKVCEGHLENVVAAIDAYRDILDLDPANEKARQALEERLSDDEHKLPVAGILEPIYEQLEQWADLVRVHEIQLEANDDKFERVALLMKIGELHAKRLGDADKAFDAYARSFREDPSAPGAKEQLEELCGLLDSGWASLVHLFEDAIKTGDLEPSLTHELAIKVADAFESRLQDSARAVEYYRRALQVEPEDARSLEALEQIFMRDEKYPELLEVYRKKVDISVDPDARLALLFRIASIHEEMLQNPDDAVSSYNEILSHDGDNMLALRALDRLYVSGEQWQDLGDNLTQQLGLCEDDHSRVELLVRLAQLREHRLSELGAAVETYRQVLDLHRDNADAVSALERLIQQPDHELAIAQILEPIYDATADWEKQVGVYEIMARHAYDPERKIELLHQISKLQEFSGDGANDAFDTYARAFREEPRSDATQGQLERLAGQLGRWRDLVTLYDEVIEAVSDDELKVQLLTKLAQIHELELSSDDDAVKTYERILEASASHVDAASAIQSIHERSGNYSALVEILRRKSEMILDLPQRKSLLYKAAQIQEEILGNPESAIATFVSVLDIDDIDMPAMDALERLYIQLERWEPLKDIYAKKAELADDPQDRKQMLHVLGGVYDRELGDLAKAIETYQAILDIDVDELSAIQALDRLYSQAERWYDLLQNLERQVELAESIGESVGLKYRIGHLWQHHLQDLARAVESYREALEMDPSHEETLIALDSLMRADDGEPILAARVLEPIYEGSAEFEKLIDALEVMVSHGDDVIQRVELLHRIAELHEYRLGLPDRAFDAHMRALREENGNELTLGHLERLADATGSFAALAELYAAEGDKSIDVPRQVDLLSRLARIYEEELGRLPDAVGTYKRILDAEFDNRNAVLSLDRLYSAAEDYPALADILRKEIQLADTDAEIIALQFRLGQVLEQSLRDLPSAIEVYREILTADPAHVGTLGALELMFLDGQHELEIAGILEPLYESAGEFEKLHKIYEVQLGKLDDISERQVMYQRLAELAERQLYDVGRAFAWWGEALFEDPRSELSIEECERLAGEAGAWDALVGVYLRVLERHVEADVQRATLLRLARVYEAELGNSAEAIDAHLRVLNIDDRDPDALEALDRLYDSAGFHDELVDVLRRRIEVTLDGDEIIRFHFRRGKIYAEALADLDAALACYEAVLEQESRNREALEAQERIFFRRDNWTKLYEVYEKLVDVADGDAELADVYAHMARIASDALNDDDGATDLWSRVLDIRGEDPLALSALADLYGRREMWEELVETIERQVSVAEAVEDQVVLYKRLGRVWAEKLNRERNALDAWLCADELNPTDLVTLRALAHLYRSTQSWEELSQTLQRIIQVGQVSGDIREDEMIELYAQLGQLEGDILGRIDDAVEAWRRVLALDPSDFRGLNSLEQLFTREARWEECIDVLEKRALVLDDEEERVNTLLQAASIWEERVDDPARAAEVYERVRKNDASNVTASDRLEAIYRDQHKWEQLNEVLLERVEHRDDSERIEILGAVAKVYEQELQEPERAFLVLQHAFELDYSHEETASELERLATAAGKWQDLLSQYTTFVASLETDNPDAAADLWVKIGRWYGDHLSHVDYAIHSIQAALRIDSEHTLALAALADFQRKRGSWTELVETLAKHAGLEEDPDKKVELYLSLAELLESQIQDPMQAIAAYRSALEADSACMAALVSLERLYRTHEMWEQLINTLGLMAELRDETDEVVRLRLEIGELWDQRLLDPVRAIDAYQDVLSTDPSSLPALRALEQLYEKTGQSESYLEILEAQLDASPTDAERISLYERMASAWEERFGKLDRAAECLEKVVTLDERNYGAYRELARLYRQDAKWDALVETYRNHILSASDNGTRIELYCAMGDVFERELNDVDRAIEAYNDVLTFDADEPRALDALGRLYETISEGERAIEVMRQLVDTTSDEAKQVDLCHRIGRIHVQLEDAEEAEQFFLRAITIDAAHVPTMEALVQLYSDRGDWLKAAQMMVRAESHAENLLDKVRLLYDAARIYLDRLSDTGQAKQYLAAVIALDPEHVEAADPLAELLFESEQWAELSPILDMLVRKTQQEHNRDPQQLNELYYRTARCADETGEFEKAIDYYKAAYDIDSTYLPTLIGRADLLFKMQDWDGAGKIYQTILVQHRESQAEADVVRIYYRMGMVRQHLGERRKSLNMFEKALEIDPTHPDTLNAVIDIQSAQGDYEAVIHAKRGLIATAEHATQVQLLDEIGHIYHSKLDNPQKAIAAYLEGLETSPNDHSLLQKVLELYTTTEQWKKAVEVIEQFTKLEKDALRRGSYFQAAGTICRDKLKSHDQAVEYYDQALNSFFGDEKDLPKSMLPRALKAFMDIDKILTTKRDWKNQERAYRRMIKRLKPGNPILVDLWHSLGEIYRSRLKHYESAIKAYEIAQSLDPTRRDRNEILAELYVVAGPDYADKAVTQHMNMLRAEPFKYDSYKSLRSIYMDTHQYDKTWCVCNTLAFLKKADASEKQFYEQYKPRGFVKAKSRMTEDIWRRVYHENENRYIGSILAAIWQGAASIGARAHKDFGLRKKDKRAIETDQLLFSKIFYYVAQVIDVALPDVYLQDDKPGEILLANCLDRGRLHPSFVVRQNLLQGRPEKDIAFVAARKLSFMRPDHYLKLALPTNTELKTALLSAIKLVKPDFPVPADMNAHVARYMPEIQRRIPVQVVEQLGMVVDRFLKAAPKVDMAQWGHAVEATGHRVGFILCGDLETAARMVSGEPTVVGGPQAKDKIKELVLYSVSEDYFAVRQHLGLTIG